MLNCKLCDYYHSLSGQGYSDQNLAICEFADLLFFDDVENLDIEYPCSKKNFEDYLQKKTLIKITPHILNKFIKPELYHELKKCGVIMLNFPDGIMNKCFMEYLESTYGCLSDTLKIKVDVNNVIKTNA